MYQLKPDHNAVVDRAGHAVAWKYDVGAKVNGGLAVVGNTIVLDDFHNDVEALDIATGRLLWKMATDNIVMSTPIVAGGMVYIGTGHNGAATPMDRHQAFVYDLPPNSQQLTMWGRPQGDHLIGLDASTGEKRWTYRTAGEDMPSAAFINGALVFANGDFHAYGLNAKTGEALWRTNLDGIATMASTAILGDHAVISVCVGPRLTGFTLALELKAGKVLWDARAGDCDSSPTLGAGKVFVSGVDGNKVAYGYGARGTVSALDARTGRVVWSYKTSNAGPYTKISSNERAITGTYSNGCYYQAFPTTDELVAFDANSGARAPQFFVSNCGAYASIEYCYLPSRPSWSFGRGGGGGGGGSGGNNPPVFKPPCLTLSPLAGRRAPASNAATYESKVRALENAIARYSVPDLMVDANIDAQVPNVDRVFVKTIMLQIPPEARQHVSGVSPNGHFFSNRFADYEAQSKLGKWENLRGNSWKSPNGEMVALPEASSDSMHTVQPQSSRHTQGLAPCPAPPSFTTGGYVRGYNCNVPSGSFSATVDASLVGGLPGVSWYMPKYETGYLLIGVWTDAPGSSVAEAGLQWSPTYLNYAMYAKMEQHLTRTASAT